MAFDNREVEDENGPYDAFCTTINYILWYQWTANYTGYFQASACNTATFNVGLVVYESCDDFPDVASVACSDGDCSSGGSDINTPRLNFPVTEGLTYYMALGSSASQKGTGTIRFSQATLNLSLTTMRVPQSGGQIFLTVSTDASDNFRVALFSNCSIIGASLTTSNTPQSITVLPRASYATCAMSARENIQGSNLQSNQVIFYVADNMDITLPIQDYQIIVGKPFDVLLETNPSTVRDAAKFTVACDQGSQTVDIASTNVLDMTAMLTNYAMYGVCSMSAVTDPVAYATTVFTTVLVYTPLSITVPANNTVWPINQPLTLLASADATATGRTVIFYFHCQRGDHFSRSGLVNEASTQTIAPTYGSTNCTIRAGGDYFLDSEHLSIIFSTPLSFSANLNGWKGGSTVPITISAYNGQVIEVQVNINCPASSQSFVNVATGSEQLLNLSPGLNGIGCLITTTDLPEYYLPIEPVSVDISLGSQATEAVVNALAPANFIGAAVIGGAGLTDNTNPNDQQQKSYKIQKRLKKFKLRKWLKRRI